jgi:hypothetical protein
MMKKRVGAAGVLLLLTWSFLALSAPLSAQEKVIKLRYSNLFPPVHPKNKNQSHDPILVGAGSHPRPGSVASIGRVWDPAPTV